jgi:hypothetical protein
MAQAQCNTCRKPLTKGAKFCGFCGAKVLDRCPKCGNANLPGPNFCIQCGAAIKDIPRSSSGEMPETELEDELKVYKASWEEGHHIITCPACAAKNRIPSSKLQLAPTCGRCKKPLPTG